MGVLRRPGREIRYRGFRVAIQTRYRFAEGAVCATATPVGAMDHKARALTAELGDLAGQYDRGTCRSFDEECLYVAQAKVRAAIDRAWARLDADGPCLGYSREVAIDGWGFNLCVRSRGDRYFVVAEPIGDLVGKEAEVERAFQLRLFELSMPRWTFDDPVDAARAVEGYLRSLPKSPRPPRQP
jgi:hypothetical protein